jgi:hypothetical protein
MTWFDVLLARWAALPVDVRQKTRESQQVHTAAAPFGRRVLLDQVRPLEQECQTEARKLG